MMRANLIAGLVTAFLVGLFFLVINRPEQTLSSFITLLSLGLGYGVFLTIRNVVELFFED